MDLHCVIPDIHGRADLLERVLHAVQTRFGICAQYVFLGDFVDRGPNSAGVLRRVHQLCRDGNCAVLGNHDELFLQFLRGNASTTLLWAFQGGAETIESFNKENGRAFASYKDLRDNLERDGLVSWLETLPHYLQVGSLSVTHAPVPARLWVNGQPQREPSLWHKPLGSEVSDAWHEALWAPNGFTAVCGHVQTPAGTHGRREPVPTCRGYFLDCGCGPESSAELIAAVFDGNELVQVIRMGETVRCA